MAEINGNGMSQEDLVQYLTNIKTIVNEIKTSLNTALAVLKGDYLDSDPVLAIGSTTTAVATGAFEYYINGVQYSKAAVAAGTAPGNDVVPEDKYGAVALDIGADGTLDATEAADNATGYTTAALAVAGLPAVAADHVRVGYVTAMKSDGAFTFGTTDLNAANTTVAYTDSASGQSAIASAVATSNLSLTI